MSRLDELPPDQRAALSLLLRQRKSYAEVALLLGIAERAVHDRAHAALAMLAPRQAREVPAARRAEVGDYLLGQQLSVAERLRTRTYLSGFEPARAWALTLAAELKALGGTPLPEIPPPTPGGAPTAQPPVPPAGGPGSRVSSLAGSSPPPASPPSSRLGGALLLAAIVVAVLVAVVLLTTGGGSSKHAKQKATSTASKTGPTVSAQLPLRSPNPNSRSVGVVAVLSEKGKRAFYIEAQHLPATHKFFYAIWLYNSATSALALSRSPAVGSNHKLAGGSTLPTNAGQFREILLTRETSGHPSHPGRVVLRGAFSLGS